MRTNVPLTKFLGKTVMLRPSLFPENAADFKYYKSPFDGFSHQYKGIYRNFKFVVVAAYPWEGHVLLIGKHTATDHRVTLLEGDLIEIVNSGEQPKLLPEPSDDNRPFTDIVKENYRLLGEEMGMIGKITFNRVCEGLSCTPKVMMEPTDNQWNHLMEKAALVKAKKKVAKDETGNTDNSGA
jgi:hypothetical protein